MYNIKFWKLGQWVATIILFSSLILVIIAWLGQVQTQTKIAQSSSGSIDKIGSTMYVLDYRNLGEAFMIDALKKDIDSISKCRQGMSVYRVVEIRPGSKVSGYILLFDSLK